MTTISSNYTIIIFMCAWFSITCTTEYSKEFMAEISNNDLLHLYGEESLSYVHSREADDCYPQVVSSNNNSGPSL